MASSRIEYEHLIAFAAGQLPPEQAAIVAAHLDSDAEAAETVARYQLAHQRFATDDSVEPTAAARARAIAIFATHARSDQSRASWIDMVDRFVARLLYDSRLQPTAVRYADVDQRINLSFEANAIDIDLQAERYLPDSAYGLSGAAAESAERWRVMGQVGGREDLGNVPVAIVPVGTTDPIAQTVADEQGTFSLDVGSGSYDILIRLPEGVIALSNISMP